MTITKNPNYVDIAVVLLRRFGGKVPFDIYVRRTESDYTKIFNANEPIDWERVASYVKKGLKYFSVSRGSYQAYLLILEAMANKFVSSETSGFTAADAGLLIREMINVSANELLTKVNIGPQAIDNATKTVMACVKTFEADPKTLFNVIRQLGTHKYLTRHSITVSILGIILAKANKFESAATLNMVGLGGFLHDVGLTQISFDTEEHDHLNAEEWKELKTHPELGKRLLDRVPNMTTEVKMIVLQHHEQPNGNGYPNGLRDNDIFVPSKIISIADSFSSLIMERPYREAMTALEALKFMREDHGKFDPALLMTFTKIFLRV